MIHAVVADEHIIALNKPAGLPSQGGSGQGDRHVDGLTAALTFGYKERPKLVHRLDKDTSGVLLLARTDRVARGLSAAFQARTTRKLYWAAVAGVPQPRRGTIRFGLVKAPGHGRGGEGEKMVCVHPAQIAATEGAKRATTDYAVLDALGTAQAVSLWSHTSGPPVSRALAVRHPAIGAAIRGSGRNLGTAWARMGLEIIRKLTCTPAGSPSTSVHSARVTLTAPLRPHGAEPEDPGWSERE